MLAHIHSSEMEAKDLYLAHQRGQATLSDAFLTIFEQARAYQFQVRQQFSRGCIALTLIGACVVVKERAQAFPDERKLAPVWLVSCLWTKLAIVVRQGLRVTSNRVRQFR